MIVFALTWPVLGVAGLYSSLLWFSFFRKVRELTDTRWVWGFLLPSPVLTLYSLWVSIRSLFSLAGSSTIGSLLGGYWVLYIFSIIPSGIAAWAGKKIREWSDLRYSLKQTNSELFTYLARKGNKTASVLITLIFLPLVFPFAALFARLKGGISPPDSVHPEERGGGETAREAGGGLYTADGSEEGSTRKEDEGEERLEEVGGGLYSGSEGEVDEG
ncbi:hypothetical protein AKJ47_01745 [candidate division MSBL1 archaeon SCGC-AAA261G05]|uniref:Uncharacterized protein n=1 Tax=candidate division MSBL1 archaeon SCGC-AAA261G05 TaxID=1698276 RepID=A0A133VB90_9EURY|nr:hypothetical protein AKJ47_01745 [candidate division MSBL1 archaeon SCGC-AAA261G05]